jgi:hypothetical protein
MSFRAFAIEGATGEAKTLETHFIRGTFIEFCAYRSGNTSAIDAILAGAFTRGDATGFGGLFEAAITAIGRGFFVFAAPAIPCSQREKEKKDEPREHFIHDRTFLLSYQQAK